MAVEWLRKKASSVTGSKLPDLIFDPGPDPGAIRSLEDRLYEFNVQATGISDGQLCGHDRGVAPNAATLDGRSSGTRAGQQAGQTAG